MGISTNIDEFISQDRFDEVRRGTPLRPKYEVIKEILVEGLESGHYDPGSALPSENTLIRKLGVARNTIRQAIDELVKDGLVKRIQGKGNYFIRNGTNGSEGRLAVFSLILPEISRGLYPTLAKGFDNQAGSLHQQILLCNTDFDINKQGNIILQMIERGVAGVALVPALAPPDTGFPDSSTAAKQHTGGLLSPGYFRCECPLDFMGCRGGRSPGR